MINELYCLLNNTTASQLSSVIAADYVPPEYEPVTADAGTISFWHALFSADVQSRQYWLCQARRAITRSFKSVLLTRFDARTAYDLSELQNELAHYFTFPNVAGLTVNKSAWWGADYQVVNLTVELTATDVSFSVGSGLAKQIKAIPSSGIVNFVIDDSQELILMVDTNLANARSQCKWAIRPKETLLQRLTSQVSQQAASLYSIAGVSQDRSSRFSKQQRTNLYSLAISPAAGQMSVAAAS